MRRKNFTLSPPRACQIREAALLARIRRSYDLSTLPLQIGPLAIEFTRVANPNRVLDDVAREEDRREKITGRRKREDELHLPYWAELWDSSLGLAHYLVRQWSFSGTADSAISHLAKNKLFNTTSAGRGDPQPVKELNHGDTSSCIRAMDLGCGMGLTGTVAARLGMQVLFADLEPPCLLFARYNSRHNASRCRARKVNWQTDRLKEPFDLILGADIVYDRSQWPFIDTFLQAHLAPGGAVVIGEPGRSSGEEFEPWITARGWKLSRQTQLIPGDNKPIHLLELTRSII